MTILLFRFGKERLINLLSEKHLSQSHNYIYTFFLTLPIFFAIILLQEFYMTKDTDHPLKICLPDGIHTYYGYDEKLPYAYLFPRMFLAFKTVAGIRYLPLSPVKKVEYALTTSRMIMTIDGEKFKRV